ncbi:MAG: DNA repair protein [Zoogloea sp.]|nr:DNA repair protein [Zoogloea sp.]
MFPLSLTLKGFRGIRDGLGRDVLTLDLERLAGDAELVALAGANGRGKSTLLDNLQPFLTLPSRATLAGPGGFSYYDHVVLPESEKDLIWLHAGRRFRSQVVIRSNGRRATEAFLFEADAEGRWHPMALPDGTVSDGKTGTYNRCIEHLLGSAETFFTSAFSAQGKRQLSAYQNSEIKTLLADLLGQEHIRNEGKKAAQVADLLKAGLVAVRGQQAGLDEQLLRLEDEHQRLGDTGARITAQTRARSGAQRAQEIAHTHLARQQAAFEQARGFEARRAQLSGERSSLIRAGKQVIEGIAAQVQAQRQRLERLEQRIAHRKAQRAAQRQTLSLQHRQCDAALQDVAAVRRAGHRLSLVESVVASRAERLQSARHQTQELSRCTAAWEVAKQRLKAIEREAGQAALRAEELTRRLGLTREVPCAGTDLQGQCKLLGDAREAQVLMPSAQGAIRRLSTDEADVRRQLSEHEARRRALAQASQVLERAERREAIARERAIRYGRLAARRREIEQALTRRKDIEGELEVLAQAPNQDGDSDEERVERLDIGTTLKALEAQHEQQAKHYRQGLDRMDEALAALPVALDGRVLPEAERALAAAQAAVAEVERAHLQAVRDAERRDALDRQIRDRKRERAGAAARIAQVDAQLGNWNLLVKCLGNDGLIALAIDDAGPTLAGLANDLLLASYGPRFTVSLLTQLETRKGEQREGFVVEVHDGESGQRKRVEQMSGGERIWVNECLVRAVALYLAQNSGRCYGTLFSDEADGALDPARKRMFVAMKREVLRLGGYAREIFISQTPELTAMADVVIDLDALSVTAQAMDV